MVREIVTLNVGQAGVQLGETIWQQYNLEHNINTEGIIKTVPSNTQFHTFYESNMKHTYTPRTLMIDLDTEAIDNLQTSKYYQLYPAEYLISGNESANGCFARGYYSLGATMIDTVSNALRLITEECDNLQGFIMNHSVGGGTGSGYGSLILDHISVNYNKKKKMCFEIYPFDNHKSTCSIEPYNALLSTHWSLDHTDISFIFDNRKLTDLCKKQLIMKQCNYFHLNSFIAKTAAGLTTSMRFDHDGDVIMDLNEIIATLVPFPRLHFLITSFAPLFRGQHIIHNKTFLIDGFVRKHYSSQIYNLKHFGIPIPLYQDIMNIISDIYDNIIHLNYSHDRLSIYDFTEDIHKVEFFSIDYPEYDAEFDKYMMILLNYRGNIKSKEANANVWKLGRNRNTQFLEWSACGFRIFLNEKEQCMLENDVMTIPDKCCVMAGNNTCISRFFNERISKVYDKMYSQRAFVHWFVMEGMEEAEFTEAREDLGFLEKDYWDVLPHLSSSFYPSESD